MESEKGKALAILSRLHIVTSTAASKDELPALTLTHNFATSLRLALTGGGDHQSFGVPASNTRYSGIDIQFLDKYATSQWEGILHFVVNSGNGSTPGTQYPTASVRELLNIGNLVDTKGKYSSAGITQAGFSFLLQEVNSQVWTILLVWLEHAESMSLDLVDVLSFIFMLGSLELGMCYSTTTLTETQQAMLPNLTDLGLIYLPSSDSHDFFPTRLATTLTSDASALRSIASGFESALHSSQASKGFVIIETNYRLYAYTSSPLQIAVLALFTKLSSRYPNMISGRITRESIRQAIDHGITSDQIISYLTTHAHPQMRKKMPILPPTVVDQIRLWQIENERMKATTGFLFKDFASQADYESVARYADEIGVLVWRSDAKRSFFVTKHEQLRDYIKSRKIK
jgi:transcription initiation factor TFIIH subunit 4